MIDSWKIYGLTVVVLFLKMLAMVLIQAYGRYKHRGFSNPEDAAIFDKLFGSQPDATKQSELVDRAQSVLRKRLFVKRTLLNYRVFEVARCLR